MTLQAEIVPPTAPPGVGEPAWFASYPPGVPHGIDPERDVTWKQFPGDVLPLTFDKGEAVIVHLNRAPIVGHSTAPARPGTAWCGTTPARPSKASNSRWIAAASPSNTTYSRPQQTAFDLQFHSSQPQSGVH